MKQFYGASRLHFIGTWRSRLPALMQELEQERTAAAVGSSDAGEDADEGVPGLPGPQYYVQAEQFDEKSETTSTSSSSIIHVDMDCFFVSVLIRTRPELWKKPVAVAHSSSAGSSEVSSCNYPARAFGLKAGMFMKQARALCPELLVLRYDFEQYEIVSKQLYKICLAFSPVVQPVSVDELYLECPPGRDVGAATMFLREEIFRQTGCSASAGQ
jgi:DNA repair protein REV1